MELDVTLNNVVCSFGLGRGLELALLVQKGVNIEMKVSAPNRCSCLLMTIESLSDRPITMARPPPPG